MTITRPSIVLLTALTVSGSLAPNVRADDTAEFAARFREQFQDLVRLDQTVNDLDDPDISVREAATQRLLHLPIQPAAAFKRLCNDDATDLETRLRIRYVFEYGAADSKIDWKQVIAMLDRIDREKITGLATEVLAILDSCQDEKHQWSCEQALLATATVEDIDVLRRAMKRPNPTVRVSTVAALTRLGTAEAVDVLLEHKNETDEAVQLALGGALIKLGRREGLPWLVNLLTSVDLKRRTRAVVLLQSATGRDEGIFSATGEEELAAAVRRWREWLAEKGSTIELRSLESDVTAKSPFD